MNITGTSDLKRKVAELRRGIRGGAVSKANSRKATRDIVAQQRAEQSALKNEAFERLTSYDTTGATVDDLHGVESPKDLMDRVQKRFPRNDLELEFQKSADLFYMAHFMMKAAGRPLTRRSKIWRSLQSLTQQIQKAMTTGAGVGAEWIPTELSRSLVEFVRLELRVAALHQRITMPTNPFELPVELADVNAFLAAEALTDNTSTESEKIDAATPATQQVVFDAVKLAVRTVWSSEISQDSIIAMAEFIRRKLAQALANAQEDATLNGDTAGTHQDTDVTSANDRRKAWDGYRKIGLALSSAIDATNAALGLANMRSTREAMGRYGINPRDLAWVVGIANYNDLLAIDELETLDVLGPQAVILTGEVGRVDGIPVIISEFIREDLAADGEFDGVTTNRSVAHLVHMDSFAYGDRESISTKSAEIIETDQLVVVTKQRMDFQRLQVAAGDLNIGTLFNLST